MLKIHAMDSHRDELKKWLTKFALCVRNQNFDAGRTMFYDDVVCFGSKADVLIGLDDLIERQWRAIWPNITDFNFCIDQFHCEYDNQSGFACVVVPWLSTGYHQDGTSFPRPGRVTILLIRHPQEGTWLAKHTHYSLYPGTPNQTFGQTTQ